MNHPAWAAGALAALAGAARAQDVPQLGYVFPAGLQRGTTAEVTIGGKNLQNVTAAHFARTGLTTTIVSRTRPMNGRERQLAQDKLRELQEQRKKAPLTPAEEEVVRDLRQKLAESRRQVSPQLAETLVLRVQAPADAAPGTFDLRLLAPDGASNPLRFQLGALAERRDREPEPKDGVALELPALVNGQILASDVDRFRFHATAGTHLVAIVEARALIPYIADAVPGWFQAALVLRDAAGRPLCTVDDRGPDPDPVLDHVIESDGDYLLEVGDALCRGREDFVYRLTVGELPYVASVFPLGARAGSRTHVMLRGANLASIATEVDLTGALPGVTTLRPEGAVEPLPFAIGDHTEVREGETGDDEPQRLQLPVVVNGVIDRPGDADAYTFAATTGDRLVAEVVARRLGSPLDSLLRLYDPQGRELLRNDDDPATASGLLTQAADSRLEYRIAASGVHRLVVSDTQQKGGPTAAYRLRIGPPVPDFALRVVPSAIAVRSGDTVAVTVHVARRDGFADDVVLALAGASAGFRLDGALVPGRSARLDVTITAPELAPGQPVSLVLEGRARLGGQDVVRTALPCEDRMQAFAYRHLVPADEFLCVARRGGRAALPALRHHDAPVKLRLGGTTEVIVADAPAGRRAPAAPAALAFVLRDPPAGITVANAGPGRNGWVLGFAAERRDDLKRLRGNLIVDVVRATAPGQAAPRQVNRSQVLTTLPAIPFTVVER